ncbi:MAG TPA: HAMP domain-containing sensor histidine kinase [Pirellulales bacterium]|nr:HAMP domain-containing sensor histidine kinase [Pirellulales bacterium]
MLWLPELIESGLSLPLSLGAAPALAAALAGEPNQPVIAALGEALCEPSLAVWAVHRAWSLECAEIRSVAAAAEWLARHAPTALDWGNAQSTQAGDERLSDEYLYLTTTTARIAGLAYDYALGDFALKADEAYWLGLLHATDRWWRLAARRRSDAGAPVDTVPQPPPWLAEALGHLQNVSVPPMAGIVAVVARARTVASDEVPSPGCHPPEADRPASKSAAALAASLPSLAALARGRSRAEFDQIEAAKLEAMAEFAAGAGHEINNPLAVISGRAQLLLDGESNAQRRRELAVIHSQAMRVHEMIADMMLFARPPRPKLAPCDLRRVVLEVVSEIRLKAAERNVDVALDLPNETDPVEIDCIEADSNQLVVAVRAICDNALAAVDRGGEIRVRLEQTVEGSPCRTFIAIVVTDTGAGISAEVRPHIFDPFYCGRQAGRGLGMGLAKAWRIVRGHQGRIEVASRPGLGSTFRIVIPAG